MEFTRGRIGKYVIIGIAAVIILPLVGGLLFGWAEKFCSPLVLLLIGLIAGYFIFVRRRLL
jgi:hypothetical protein